MGDSKRRKDDEAREFLKYLGQTIAETDASERTTPAEWYAGIYRNFVDRQEWFDDLFLNMNFWEYRSFQDYFWERSPLANDPVDPAELRRVKGLIVALARKELEVARFMPRLTEDQREHTLRTAQSYYELAKPYYPPDAQKILEAAWNKNLEYGLIYGWPSVIFEVISPHKLFRDPTDDELREIMMTTGEQECPRCGGLGTLPTPTREGSDPDIPAERFDEPTCPVCKGTGVVPI